MCVPVCLSLCVCVWLASCLEIAKTQLLEISFLFPLVGEITTTTASPSPLPRSLPLLSLSLSRLPDAEQTELESNRTHPSQKPRAIAVVFPLPLFHSVPFPPGRRQHKPHLRPTEPRPTLPCGGPALLGPHESNVGARFDYTSKGRGVVSGARSTRQSGV